LTTATEIERRNSMPTSHDDLGNGEGKVLYDQQVALSRDEQGTLHAVSSVCTHMGCDVDWNGGQKSWDCPCHGSRFRPTGEVLHGPATLPLPKAEIPD
jgi:Rieske Fe-S protein